MCNATQQLVKVNKHVMTDGAREYYRTAEGEWRPGYYDGRKFVWTSTVRFSARQRTQQTADGTPMEVRNTRYTTGSFLKPTGDSPTGKSGGSTSAPTSNASGPSTSTACGFGRRRRCRQPKRTANGATA